MFVLSVAVKVGLSPPLENTLSDGEMDHNNATGTRSIIPFCRCDYCDSFDLSDDIE